MEIFRTPVDVIDDTYKPFGVSLQTPPPLFIHSINNGLEKDLCCSSGMNRGRY